ncbi:PEP-CTERM sorting domain-containing protein [Pontiella sp.]|uniref:PEP-CTERM sorting domain-containing protein n=1 Tax=Pontiella sp. TaxID=2837462 RepID=UPI0035661788
MKKAICVITLVLMAAGAANAAVITWTTGTIAGSNDVVNTGTTVEAFNGKGGTPSTSTIVNGVTFADTGTLLDNSYSGDVWTPAMTDAGYDSLLSSVDYQSNGTGDLSLYTFTGLTIGQDYLFQYWYADSNWQAPNPDRYITISLGADTQSGDNQISGLEFATATFTADATSIEVVTSATHNGVRMTAMQLRAVPEPATLGLLAAFGGGILFVRRFLQI